MPPSHDALRRSRMTADAVAWYGSTNPESPTRVQAGGPGGRDGGAGGDHSGDDRLLRREQPGPEQLVQLPAGDALRQGDELVGRHVTSGLGSGPLAECAEEVLV